MPILTLASTSPARKKLLTEAGISFRDVPPGVDEEALEAKHLPKTACDLTLLLAKAKAEAVAHKIQKGLVLGCDSALELDGAILGKPLEPEVAIQRWKQMRGTWGTLHSGHHLIDTTSGETATLCTQTRVKFADLSDQEIDNYVATGEPLHVAGAFTIDSIGGAYIEKIDGDYHTVVGLSLYGIRSMCQRIGVEYESLWR